MAMGVGWWGIVSDHLDSRPYMLSRGPSALDATAYGFLDSYLGAVVFKSPVHDFVASRVNLVNYWKRLREQYWSELIPSAEAQRHTSAAGAGQR